MKILFLHGVSAFGGSTKSLMELYTQLKLHGVAGTVLCPAGKSEESLSNIGMRTHTAIGISQFDNTFYGYYKGLRWLVLIRELAFLLPTIIALLRVKINSRNFDIIHANEITLLPIAILAKKLFKCPLVVHVRSVQRGNSNDIRSKILFRLLNKYADSVVAIDETVQASIANYIDVNVVHNGINLPTNIEKQNDRILPETPRVGIIGTLLRLKGVYEFFNAARILLVERNLRVEFVVVGENARATKGIRAWIYKKLGFSDNTMGDLIAFIKDNNIAQHFDVKGFVMDVRTIYSNLDILCFPSHLNAAGRPVFEAALFGIPSIVAVREPKADTIIDKETGICIDSPDPVALADAIGFLIENPHERIRLGSNAQKLALNNFDINKNANLVVEIYRDLLLN